jgi:hypothetical protein
LVNLKPGRTTQVGGILRVVRRVRLGLLGLATVIAIVAGLLLGGGGARSTRTSAIRAQLQQQLNALIARGGLVPRLPVRPTGPPRLPTRPLPGPCYVAAGRCAPVPCAIYIGSPPAPGLRTSAGACSTQPGTPPEARWVSSIGR